MTFGAPRVLLRGDDVQPRAAAVSDRSPEGNPQVRYLIWTPEMARAMISRWISEVPSKMV